MSVMGDAPTIHANMSRILGIVIDRKAQIAEMNDQVTNLLKLLVGSGRTGK